MGNATQEAFFSSYLQTTQSRSDDFSVNGKIPIVHMLVQVGMKAVAKKSVKKTKSAKKVEEQIEGETEGHFSSDIAAAGKDQAQAQDVQADIGVSSDASSESLTSILEKLTPRQQAALQVASRWVRVMCGTVLQS